MQRILNLIEETLDAEVPYAELAEEAGYSPWHFLRLFREEVGMPLSRYRTKRRLAHAIWHISEGISVTDAALRWGFDTHSGFYRAFLREYGMSPTAYLRGMRVHEPRVPLLKEEIYRMLTHEQFRTALKQWNLDLPLNPVHYPDSGHTSETSMYVGDKFVLKAYRDGHTCRLALHMSEALRKQGIPAGEAVPLPDGRMSVEVCGMQLTLSHRVPGTPMSIPALLEDPEGQGRRIGAALAKLHRALDALCDLTYADDLNYPAHIIDWALPRAREALPPEFPADYAERVARLDRLGQGLIHRDPHPGNLLDAGENIGFVDFDLSVRSVRLFDPCYAATAVLSECFGRDDLPWETAWPALCRAILRGYDAVTPLTEAEWNAVPLLLVGNELMCLAAFAKSNKYRDVFETNRRMLHWLMRCLPQQ